VAALAASAFHRRNNRRTLDLAFHVTVLLEHLGIDPFFALNHRRLCCAELRFERSQVLPEQGNVCLEGVLFRSACMLEIMQLRLADLHLLHQLQLRVLQVGNLVLQAGERTDEASNRFIEACVREIKEQSVSTRLPNGVGITLSLGEQSYRWYKRFFDAGAHRYLLRLETSDPALFARLHPETQTIESRMEALSGLKDIGYQVGTGVMIGLPGQSVVNLARDIRFFRERDVDMIGMGPYLVHKDTPMADWPDVVTLDSSVKFHRTLNMIAVTRCALKDVNIAATTALQAVDPVGREKALHFGANVVMPQLTPQSYRRAYQLYNNKPCVDEHSRACLSCLKNRITGEGRTPVIDGWGDAPHFFRRTKKENKPVSTVRTG